MPSKKPATRPLQVIVNESETPVEDDVTQLMGLLAKCPLIVAAVTTMSLVLVIHPERWPSNEEGFVPPPAGVSGGENLTFINSEQVTDPGAGPLKGWAEAGEANPNRTTSTDNMRATAEMRTADHIRKHVRAISSTRCHPSWK